MDLGSIFGLNSRFGAVLGRITDFRHWLRRHSLKPRFIKE